MRATKIVEALGELDMGPVDSEFLYCHLCLRGTRTTEPVPSHDSDVGHDSDCPWVLARRWVARYRRG